MKTRSPVILEDNALSAELASLRAALAHYQHAAANGALQAQRQSIDINEAMERQKQLEAEKARFQQELSVLSHNPDKQPHPATLNVSELTLAHRRLSDRLSATEGMLLERTTELNHAVRQAENALAVAERSQGLLNHQRREKENEAKRFRALQGRLKAATEEKLMYERCVEEYAILYRRDLGRKADPSESRQSQSLSPASPIFHDSVSSQSEIGRVGLQRLLGELNEAVEPLQQQIFRLQSELDDIRIQLEVERRGSEEERTKLALSRVELEQYLNDDRSAAKLVSRYMKFSQTSIDLLQTALDNQRTRSEARIATMEGQNEALEKALSLSQLRTTRLRDALDELTEEISKETYGRRREIALRLKLVNREEHIVAALRSLGRRLEEGCERQSLSPEDQDSPHASWELLKAIWDETASLIRAVEDVDNSQLFSGPEDKEDGGAVSRVTASQAAVTSLVEELQTETEKRLMLERRLGELLSLGSSDTSNGVGEGVVTSSDLGVGWSKETLVAQPLSVHPISPFQRLTFGRGAPSAFDSLATPISPSPASSLPLPNPNTSQSTTLQVPKATVMALAPPGVTLSSAPVSPVTALPEQSDGVEIPPIDSLSSADHPNTVQTDTEGHTSDGPIDLFTPTLSSSFQVPPSAYTHLIDVTSPIPPTNDPEIQVLLDDLSEASVRYRPIAASLKNCSKALTKLKAESPMLTTTASSSPLTSTYLDIPLANAYLAQLNDILEDCQVEVEIRMADEARLITGFQTILSIPTALAHADDRRVMIEQVATFLQGTRSGAGPKEVFERKLEDIEHDTALLKRVLHDATSDIGSDQSTPSAATSTSPWSWPTALLSSPSRSRPASPGPTFGAVMTQRPLPAHSRSSSTSTFFARERLPSLVELSFRNAMPKQAKPTPSSPLSMSPSLSIPGRLNPFLMRSRTTSSSGIPSPPTRPQGLKGMRYASGTHSVVGLWPTLSSSSSVNLLPTGQHSEPSEPSEKQSEPGKQKAVTSDDDGDETGTETETEGGVSDIE